MTREQPTPGKARGGKAGGIVALAILAGLFGAGTVFLMSAPNSRFGPAALVSVDEYLTLKSAKKVRAAWLEKSDLYAEVDPEYVRDGERFRYVVAMVPPATLNDPAAWRELQTGIDPSRFTVLRK